MSLDSVEIVHRLCLSCARSVIEGTEAKRPTCLRLAKLDKLVFCRGFLKLDRVIHQSGIAGAGSGGERRNAEELEERSSGWMS